MAALDYNLGAVEIGVLMGMVLYGVGSLQAFVYTERNVDDSPWLQNLVCPHSSVSLDIHSHVFSTRLLWFGGYQYFLTKLLSEHLHSGPSKQLIQP